MCDRLFDRRLVAAKRMGDAIDDHLWRIDFALPAGFGIGALAVGLTVERERVVPAEIVPLVDIETERDERGIARQFTH